MTPTPQGVGVFESDDWKEVVEMTEDDTGTTRVRTLLDRSITLDMQGSVPKAESPPGAGNKGEKNG